MIESGSRRRGSAAGRRVRPSPATLAQWFGSGSGPLGALRVLLVASLVIAVVFGIVATAVVASTSSATDQFTTHAEPLVVDLQQLYTTLDDADATMAAAYLSGPVIASPRRDEYDSDVARAESLLAASTRAVAGNDAASARLAAIAAQIPVYTGLVATAQAGNRLATAPQPLGTAYLNEASNLMRSVLLPETLAAYQTQRTSLDAVQGDATGIWWLLLAVQAVTLVVLGVAQRQIARRTRRVLNPGLLTATVVLVAAIGWTTVAMVVHREHLGDARSQGTARIEALGIAAEAAIQAHSDEALTLIAHGSDNGAYANDFTGQIQTASAALNDPVLAGGAATAQVTDARDQIATWSALDAQVRAKIVSGDYQAAVTATLGGGPSGGTSAVAARIGGDLNAAMTAAQRTFVTDGDAARSALSGLLAAEIIAAVLIAAAAGYGINRRLAEYR